MCSCLKKTRQALTSKCFLLKQLQTGITILRFVKDVFVMNLQHVPRVSSSVTMVSVSHHRGFVTARMIVRTSPMKKTAVSDISPCCPTILRCLGSFSDV